MGGNLVITLLNVMLPSGATALLSACNATAGAGQDVNVAGQAVTNCVEKVTSGL
jgi:predicted small secreted protein